MRTQSLRCVATLAMTALATACAIEPASDEGSSPPVAAAHVLHPELHKGGAIHANKRLCPHERGKPACEGRILTDEDGTPLFSPSYVAGSGGGYGPADLASAYNIPTSIQSRATIAIVDESDNPNAESDLAVYRSGYGLPACTTANGCFQKIVLQSGSPPTTPGPSLGWAGEIAMDLEMASAGCPSCKIILVEDDDLFAGIDAAVNAGANVVSMSWSGNEIGDQAPALDYHFSSHPNVAFFAAAGDVGYDNDNVCDGSASCPTVPNYPASSPYVVAVGGTSLRQLLWEPGAASRPSRFWTESAWSLGGSGCSVREAKPFWQTDRGCSMRSVVDVSAVADLDTGVAVYTTFAPGLPPIQNGWSTGGGTSAAAPLVAGIYAQTRLGNTSSQFLYDNASSWFYDVTSGSNGPCGTYLCNAGPGYDGPTGIGTPNGAGMANSAEVLAISPTAGWNTSTTNIAITGSHFSTYPGFTQVTVGGVAATNVSCSSPSQCTATVPANASFTGTVDVVVNVGGHLSPIGAQDQFTYERRNVVVRP